MLGVLYDLHGNLPALEAVLEDAAAQPGGPPDRWLLGGDYATFGAWPNDVLRRIDELPGDVTMLRGNHERWFVDRHDWPETPQVRQAVLWTARVLGDEVVARLSVLPEQVVLDGTLFCHAAPGSDMRGVAPEPAGDDAEVVADVPGGRLVVGHTHLQFRRTAGSVEVVNPGSVGLPFDGDRRAAYALVRDDGELELRRVEYDTGVVLRALEDLDEDWGAFVARVVETARL